MTLRSISKRVYERCCSVLASGLLVGAVHLGLFLLADCWYGVFWQPSVFFGAFLASVCLWLAHAVIRAIMAARARDWLMFVIRPLCAFLACFGLNMLFFSIIDHVGERALFYWFLDTEPPVLVSAEDSFPLREPQDTPMIPYTGVMSPGEVAPDTGTEVGAKLPFLTSLVCGDQAQLLQYLSTAPEWKGYSSAPGELRFAAYMAAEEPMATGEEASTGEKSNAFGLCCFEWSFYREDQQQDDGDDRGNRSQDDGKPAVHWFSPRVSLAVYRARCSRDCRGLQRLEAYLKRLSETHGGSLPAALPEARRAGASMRVLPSAGMTSVRGLTGESSFVVGAWVNPGECGTVFVRLYESSRNRQVPLRFYAAPMPVVGYSEDPSEVFYVRSYACSPHAGIAGRPYNARVELWFRPWDSSREERLLIAQPCRMDGQGDQYFLSPATPMGDMMELLL